MFLYEMNRRTLWEVVLLGVPQAPPGGCELVSGGNGLEKHITLAKNDVVVIADSSAFPSVKSEHKPA